VNAHHASECRQGSIPEPHRGQVSMRLEKNEEGTKSMGRAVEAVWPPTAYIWRMCGRFTRHYTWQQIQALYRLTVAAAIPNLRPDYNVCPTDPGDVVVAHDGARERLEMRWGLVPFCGASRLRTCGSRPSTPASRR
jgi:hypothetical protein